ncbi:Ni/Fe-hydrogenase, b-type cytochrome subunit [Escherichia coli]|uniref:Ni/Fe-hydrogenase, b-type cytochrome subunit n=1 Tax=Escherichia coli TaxID=562 RepID=UPI000854DEB1|nr:Ni/Fe-hydrogenase, b-type cytochrome subunit [Escherichia coli]EET7734893.1 Ni/Fe-hydrogenase, b-type cytochrome subunit [Escherichia coli]EEX9039607.1 Ni/Fe-hydrogenase, b-type cytochrome subunit [Escherichia coli]EFJ8039230.1 Ni/Fe-hydrogenase, b-type cytochrome subunit [Escherichia coli]EJS2621887.1 Ni/Fe-hydrogenase, b-type cytochrome subunit [Escherichia coli]EKE5038054.1 Ni/Fe-hydrogenase, b-type cytochrome subunit [Escherichia coli]
MSLKEVQSKGYYIYEAPVRIWHWITFISVTILSVTGYLIAHPVNSNSGDTSYVFFLGWVRLIHFSAGYTFLAGILLRIYWAIWGNKFSRELFIPPFWRKEWIRGVVDELRWYLFLEKTPHKYLGHNPVAMIAVSFYFWVSVFMVLSGFALYGEGLGYESWAYKLFGWMIYMTGGNSLLLHSLHRFGMWLTITFVLLHVYTVIREEIMSRQSMLSSMISGWRWFR